jgi:hypothetical protein
LILRTAGVTLLSTISSELREGFVPELRSHCVLVLFLSVLTPTTHAGEKPWTEVRSPDFRILTDGTASEGRRVAREFEQMRAVFAIAFPKMRLETGAPLIIFAPRDDFSMKALAPAQWKPTDSRFAALFRLRVLLDSDAAMVRAEFARHIALPQDGSKRLLFLQSAAER